MKILFLAEHTDGTDGWSRVAQSLLFGMQKKGAAVLCMLRRDMPAEEKKSTDALRCMPLLYAPLLYTRFPWLSWWSAKRISSLIRREAPDIIHIIAEPYMLLLPFLRVPKKTRIVLTAHGTYATLLLSDPRTRSLAERAYERIDRIIAVSEFTKARLLAVQPALSSKITVAYNGIAVGGEMPKPVQRGPHYVPTAVFIGGVKERKGLKEAIAGIHAYQMIYKKPVRFEIIGAFDEKSPYVQALHRLIQEYHLEDSVRFLGHLSEEEKNARLLAADVFLMLPSSDGPYVEGFGLVYLEANAFGVPVIGPEDGAPAEIIKNGISGYTVARTAPEAVAARLHDVIDNHTLSRASAHAWAKTFSLVRQTDAVYSVYTSV